MKKRSLPPALRRTLYLGRRPLAALCAFLAVLATLLAFAPSPDHRVTVVAASSALPAGTVVTRGHLMALDLPADVVPDGAALTEKDVVGRTLAAAVAARTVLTRAAVSEGDRLARPGHVVVSLPLADEAIAALIRPGARIDVIDAAGEMLATDVAVVAPPDTPTGGNFSLGGSARSILVEVPVEIAAKLASQGVSSLTVAVR